MTFTRLITWLASVLTQNGSHQNDIAIDSRRDIHLPNQTPFPVVKQLSMGMLDPVNLQLFPSCDNCLSWSADGELAVAAGEYVHILVGLDA